MKRVLTFVSEVKLEVSKVTWPKRESVIKLTLIVFLVSGILGAYVGGIDFLFTKALALIVVR